MDIRRKVKSSPMEKEGCCCIPFMPIGTSKVHPTKANLRVLARGSPHVLNVGFYSRSCTLVTVDSGHCMIQGFRLEDESPISDPLHSTPCLFVYCCCVFGFLLLFVYLVVFVFCFSVFLPENENQTWNLQRSKNLKVTIVPSIKGWFGL